MTITSLFSALARQGARQVIRATPIRDAYRAANALYEALWNAPAPQASTQTYRGHDHTPWGGGGVIHRGGLWSETSITSPLWDHTFTEAGQEIGFFETYVRFRALARYITSPGVPAGSPLRGWLCVRARGESDFFLRYRGLDLAKIEVTGAESRYWLPFSIPTIEAQPRFETPLLSIKCGSFNPEDPPRFELFGITIAETAATVSPLNRGGKLLEGIAGRASDLVASAFASLPDEIPNALEWLDAVTLQRLYSFVSALHEGAHDWRAPSAVAQVCRGHDHGGYGGAIVARGRQYTAALGTNPLYQLDFQHLSSSTFYPFDEQDGGSSRTTAGFGMARYLPSSGMTSTGSPPTDPPYMTAAIYVRGSDGSASRDLHFRARRTGTANVSAVTIVAGVSSFEGWLILDKIPCTAETLNEITIEAAIFGGGVGSWVIELWALQVYEEAGAGGQNNHASRIALGGGVA